MTFTELERDVLSFRCWLRRSVLPTGLALLAVLIVLALVSDGDGRALDHRAVIVGFFALYLVLIRGGHLVMIRSLHAELKRLCAEPYAARLAKLPSLKGRNAGFALARIKRNLIDEGVIPNPNKVPD